MICCNSSQIREQIFDIMNSGPVECRIRITVCSCFAICKNNKIWFLNKIGIQMSFFLSLVTFIEYFNYNMTYFSDGCTWFRTDPPNNMNDRTGKNGTYLPETMFGYAVLGDALLRSMLHIYTYIRISLGSMYHPLFFFKFFFFHSKRAA